MLPQGLGSRRVPQPAFDFELTDGIHSYAGGSRVAFFYAANFGDLWLLPPALGLNDGEQRLGELASRFACSSHRGSVLIPHGARQAIINM